MKMNRSRFTRTKTSAEKISPKNKKVKNATPTIIDGIKFKSKLEANTYAILKQNNIFAEYESFKFILLDSFEFDGKKLRKMTYTPDFVGTDFIIECKGLPTDAFKLKWKLFQWHLKESGLENKYKLHLIHNLKELDKAIDEIKIKRIESLY